MASRTLTPLRTTSRRLCQSPKPQCWSQLPCRTLVSASKAKQYAQPSTATRAAAASTTTAPKTTPSQPPTPSKPTTIPRKPVPAVSGTPLPDAPSQPAPSILSPSLGDSDLTSTNGAPIDWTQSYHGLGTSAFAPEAAAILQAPLDPDDIEVKPDGIIYLPEIKYRRILNAAFGPGGWGLAPRGQLTVHEKLVTREYALVVQGRFVAQARGEQQYFSEEGVSTAAEGCKSNALMRCCKDLGIASELWDPRFIRKFMKEHAVQQWVEHVTTKKRKQIWLRKDDEVRYPFKKT
ncbi:Mgm101p-domain-containing protein [Hypomontagnella submonticulosa]|nr:Mgm101p-domain-containing protein [Hypomontagnella submonticulosa]